MGLSSKTEEQRYRCVWRATKMDSAAGVARRFLSRWRRRRPARRFAPADRVGPWSIGRGSSGFARCSILSRFL